jgi:hypothetical protein
MSNEQLTLESLKNNKTQLVCSMCAKVLEWWIEQGALIVNPCDLCLKDSFAKGYETGVFEPQGNGR